MVTLSGVFGTLESAERACRQLETRGIGTNQLSVIVDEDCPACAHLNDRERQESSERTYLGQGFGALLGIALGIVAMIGPLGVWFGAEWVPADLVGLSFLDLALMLFIIGCWTLSGALLGGLAIAAGMEAWETLGQSPDEKLRHSHCVLKVDAPSWMAAEVRELIQARGGRLDETSAFAGKVN